jgi:hypothetical protein
MAREEACSMLRAFGLVLTLLMVIPCATQAASNEKPSRRAAPVISRCGRHIVEVVRGIVRLDGKSLESSSDKVDIVVAPTWRRDCDSVAWMEQQGTERRLIVVPAIDAAAPSLSWVLPRTVGDERIFWVGRRRIAVGVAMLQPRAMASWS